MYTVLIVVLLVLVSLTLIAYPIWKGHVGEGEQLEGLSPIATEKDVIMGTLSELEFDYHMKKLSEDDYRSLKNKYAKVALAIIDTEDTDPTGDTRISRADLRANQE